MSLGTYPTIPIAIQNGCIAVMSLAFTTVEKIGTDGGMDRYWDAALEPNPQSNPLSQPNQVSVMAGTPIDDVRPIAAKYAGKTYLTFNVLKPALEAGQFSSYSAISKDMTNFVHDALPLIP